MRTIDEVIAELEDEGLFADALHYLREYRKLDSLDAIAFPEDDNPPLSWQELKQLEGKPVWVELPKSSRKAWGLNDGTFLDAFGHEIVTIKVLHDLWHLDKAQMDKTWQAYRKERE